MANVGFKRGLSTKLFDASTGKVKITPVEGTFYLTTDTNRLYIAQNTGSAVELKEINRYIQMIDDYDHLPGRNQCAKGDFYYAITQNSLCVCINPDAPTILERWQQVNEKDTNTVTTIGGNKTATIESITGEDAGLKISFNLTQSVKDKDTTAKVTNVPVSFTIPANDLVAASKVAVKVGSDSNGIISLSGAGSSNETNVKISAGDNVIVDASTANTIKIGAVDTKYALTGDADNTALTFGEIGAATKSYGFKSSDETIQVSYDEATTSFDFKHKAYDTVTEGTPEKAIGQLNYGDKITAVISVDNEKGHVTGWKTQAYQLPDLVDTKVVQEGSSLTLINNATDKDSIKNGAVKLTLKQPGANDIVLATDPISYTINKTSYAPGSTLPVYTITDINDKLRAIDAMVYKGTVSSDDDLPISNVSIGDTYKVAVEGTYAGNLRKVGDILIAKAADGSQEDSDGHIPSDKIAWDYIESGNEDTTYTITAATVDSNPTISLASSSDPTNPQKITLAGNNDVNVTANANKITISHAAVGLNSNGEVTYDNNKDSTATDKKPGYNGTFKVIDGLVLKNGHVSNFTTKTVQLPDLQNTTYTPVANAVTTTEKKHAISIQLKDNNKILGTAANVEIASNSLNISTTAATQTTNAIVTMDLTWGSF